MSSRADWFAENILPHEPQVRLWLRRCGWSEHDVEDMIQESYAKLAAFPKEQIRNPGAFFFQTARNVASAIIRRRQIVSIRAVADIERVATTDTAPDAQSLFIAYEELMRLKAAIEGLPRACRRVLVMRKIEGLSQAETARRLGVSESNVEKHVARGIRLCAAALANAPSGQGTPSLFSQSFGTKEVDRDQR